MNAVKKISGKLFGGKKGHDDASTMVVLLAFRVVNMALAYILVVALAAWFTASDYILFEKIMFFLMIGNIFLSPILIAMWHEQIVEHLVIEGLIILVSLSIVTALLLYISTQDILLTVVVTSCLYFFCYYIKTTLYTHLITLKQYYRAYGTNTLFYAVYITSIFVFGLLAYYHSYLVSFLFFPSLILTLYFLFQWKKLISTEVKQPEATKKKLGEIFSIALLSHGLMTLLLSSGERFVLEGYATTDENTLAAFLYLATIVSAFQSLGISIGEWLRPQVFEKMKNGESLRTLYKKAILMLLGIFIIFTIAGWPILQLISEDKTKYFSFFPYFGVLALSQLLIVLTFFIDLQIVFKKRYILLVAASTLAVIGKATGYYLWDGLSDLSGVVYANLLGAAIFFISMTFFVRYSSNN